MKLSKAKHNIALGKSNKKHIKLQIPFMRKCIHNCVIEVLLYFIYAQFIENFKKSLLEEKFSKLWSMLGVQGVFTKVVYALIPPSLFYYVTFVNPSILSQVFLKGAC